LPELVLSAATTLPWSLRWKSFPTFLQIDAQAGQGLRSGVRASARFTVATEETGDEAWLWA
jgi:hypothetical protein